MATAIALTAAEDIDRYLTVLARIEPSPLSAARDEADENCLEVALQRWWCERTRRCLAIRAGRTVHSNPDFAAT